MLAKTIRYPLWGRKIINNGVTTGGIFWSRALRSFLCFARALVYRAGPANSPVLQASTYRVLKALTYRTYSSTDMYMTIATTALKSNSSNSPKTYIWNLKLLRIVTTWLIIRCCRKSLTPRTVSWKLESQTANVTTLKDGIVRFFEARGSQYYLKNSLLKVSSKAKQLCIVKINVVTVSYPATRAGSEEGRLLWQAKYPPSQNKTKKSCRDSRRSWRKKQIPARCKGPTSHHFSNGPSLNRILVFQDHVGRERGAYVLIHWYRFLFGSRLTRLYGWN